MYIIAILDEGRERNFRCSSVMMTPDGLFLIAGERSYHFRASDLISIIAVEQSSEVEQFASGVEQRSTPWLRLAGNGC
jgi:6-phosphogluconolactonase (cycloisomerase 2 family)